MRNFIIFLILFSFFTVAPAQVALYWSDNFDDENISDWTLIDSDGDGENWKTIQITDDDGNPAQIAPTPVLRSYSWYPGGPLSPDNWAISPAIDLSYSSSDVFLIWEVMAVDPDWDEEHYTVYVATEKNINAFLNSTVMYDEPSLDGVNALTQRSLDVTGFAGEPTVYVAFRHHGVTNQFTMEIDNVRVGSGLSSVDEFTLDNPSTVFPNPAKDIVNISLSEVFDASKTTISLTNMVGQKVADFSNAGEVNVGHLPTGMYIMTITDGNITEVLELMKK